MSTRVYATAADYLAYTGDAATSGPRLARLLTLASTIVERPLMTAVYATDPQGYPAGAELVDTLMKATCEQVAYMAEVGDDTLAAARFESVAIGNMSFKRAAGSTAPVLPPVAPMALSLLQQIGVLPQAPYTDAF